MLKSFGTSVDSLTDQLFACIPTEDVLLTPLSCCIIDIADFAMSQGDLPLDVLISVAQIIHFAMHFLYFPTLLKIG